MKKIKAIFDGDFEVLASDNVYTYQLGLTTHLDSLSGTFDQNTINELVLWKENRYVGITDNVLNLLNQIKTDSTQIDKELTNKILSALLQIKGIGLPMASTMLRFKNKNIYQIIDQRVYRILYKEPLKLTTYKSEKNRNAQIKLYLQYLEDLRNECKKNSISFTESDRILYNADKRLNKNIPLNGYGARIKKVKD